MRRIDALHLDDPFAGSRMLRDLVRGEGVAIGRELVTTMVRRMGIEAIYRKPKTPKAALGQKIYHSRYKACCCVRFCLCERRRRRIMDEATFVAWLAGIALLNDARRRQALGVRR